MYRQYKYDVKEKIKFAGKIKVTIARDSMAFYRGCMRGPRFDYERLHDLRHESR